MDPKFIADSATPQVDSIEILSRQNNNMFNQC